jgi:hypothetical protein
MVAHDGTRYTIFVLESSPASAEFLRTLSSYRGVFVGRLNRPLHVRPCGARDMEDAAREYETSNSAIFMTLPSRQVIVATMIINWLTTNGVAKAKQQFGQPLDSRVTGAGGAPMNLAASMRIGSDDPMSELASKLGAAPGSDSPANSSVPSATFARPGDSGDNASYGAPRQMASMAPSSDSPMGGGGGAARASTSSYSRPSRSAGNSSNKLLSMVKEGLLNGNSAADRIVNISNAADATSEYFANMGVPMSR